MLNTQKHSEMYMKSLIVKTFLLTAIASSPLISWGQTLTADPLVSAAVGIASGMEQKKLDNINNKQSGIMGAQAVINRELDRIRSLQKKTYEYLSHVSGAVQSANDIKRSAEYTILIGKLCIELKDAIAENPQGLVTTVVGTKQITQIKEEMTSLYLSISAVANNPKLLLNTTERLMITARVLDRLRSIHFDMFSLVYLVRSLSFKDLPRLLVPEIYYSTVSQKTIAENIINSW